MFTTFSFRMEVILLNRIASERKLKGLSQEDLATKLEVGRSTIIRWEKGDSVPDDKLKAMRTLFCCDLDWLVGLSEERKEVKTDATTH